MAQNNMHNLTTLIKRLEAATSRLEDIASSTFEKPAGLDAAPAAQSAPAAQAVARAAPPAPAAPGAPAAPAKADVPPMLAAFDALLDNELKEFLDLSKDIGGSIAEQASALSEAFAAQRQFLQVSTLAKKPDMASPVFLEVLKDLQGAIEKVDQVKQISKDRDLKNHLTMVGDGVGVLGWVTMDSKPGDVAAELFGGAQMYGNKVLKEYKETDRTHVEWVQSFYRLFKSLILYIKNNHAKGVQWNPNGIDAAEALRQVKSGGTNGVPAAPPAGGAPPPPPPPPLPNFDNIPPPPPGPAPIGKKAAPDMGAVFNELNKGEAVTSGLRKVDASQMTHKNPSLRANSTVPERKDSTGSRGKSPAPPGKKPKPESMRAKKPPKVELDGNKWIIENFEDHPEPLEIEATIVQSILITKCNKTTIRVKGKGNAISIDNSSRASIVIDSLVSSVDVIRCPNFALQVMGTLPTLLLDQVDGAAVYLGKESLETEIFSSKCTSVNINLPPSEEEEDYTEHPIPEQFKTYVKDGKLVSEIVEHAG